MRTSRIFNQLEGNWVFTRIIHGPEIRAQVTGNAKFIRDSIDNNPSLFYREEGELTTNNLTTPIYKEYLYLLSKTNISVYFSNNKEQGNLYHTLEFQDAEKNIETWKATAFHLCGQDSYNTEYIFQNKEEKFKIIHTVKGPNKNYTSDTTFERSI